MEHGDLERMLETQVENLGYELVELEQLGSKTRPLLRIRIDRPGSEPGKGVTIDDCARVSRALEHYLDNRGDAGDRYTLEVSSPGIERPLVKRKDFERFAGREIALKLHTPLAPHGKRVEGVLSGVEDSDGREYVRLSLSNQDIISIPRDQIAAARLVFRWDE